MADGKFVSIESGRKKLKQAIDASTGATDSDKIIRTDSNGKIDQSFFPTGIGADTKIIEASENLDAGDFVNIFDDTGTTKVRKADASNDRPANGFILVAANSGNNATVYFEGENNGLSGLSGGTRYYLDTAGDITSTAKTASGELHQYLGTACSATSINVEMSESVIIE